MSFLKNVTFLNQRVGVIAIQLKVLFTNLAIYKVKYLVVLIVIALIKFPNFQITFST